MSSFLDNTLYYIGIGLNFLILCLFFFLVKEAIAYFFNFEIKLKALPLLITLGLYVAVCIYDFFPHPSLNSQVQIDMMTILNIPGLMLVHSLADLINP